MLLRYHLIFLLVLSITLSAEEIQTKEGKTIRGSIINKTQNELIIQAAYGIVRIPLTNIIWSETLIEKLGFDPYEQKVLTPLYDIPNQETIKIEIVHSFTNPVASDLGLEWNVWLKDPNDTSQTCQAFIVNDNRNNEKDRVLKIIYDVESTSNAYNGFYMKLGSKNLQPFDTLSFWIRGDAQEPFTTTLKTELKSSLVTSSYYIKNITPEWQKIQIPLNKFKTIKDWTCIKEFTIVFEDYKVTQKTGVIYIDDIAFEGNPNTIAQTQEAQLKKLATRKQKFHKSDINISRLLQKIEKKLFLYFLHESHPTTGLTQDRMSSKNIASIAATGFALTTIPIGIEQGWITQDQAFTWTHKTLFTLLKQADHEHGYFYHFLDIQTAKRASQSEVSSIDTALLMAGVLFAGQYFKDTAIEDMANQIYDRIEWNWMVDSTTQQVYHAWTPEKGFSTEHWDTYSEQMILYILGLGSNTYAFPTRMWTHWERPIKKRLGYEYISSPGESLFTYVYSHAWIDFRYIEDQYTNYWNNSVQAVSAHYAFCTRLSRLYAEKQIWGLSASDGPTGYYNYGAEAGNHDGTLAPYAVLSSLPMIPHLVIPSIQALYQKQGAQLWGKYGFTSAYNLTQNWYSDDYIGIDQGISLLMIENYQSEFVWKNFMEIKAVQRGLKKAGFHTSNQRFLARAF